MNVKYGEQNPHLPTEGIFYHAVSVEKNGTDSTKASSIMQYIEGKSWVEEGLPVGAGQVQIP